MRSRRLWTALAVIAAVVIVALLVWRPWRHDTPASASVPAAGSAPGASQTPRPGGPYERHRAEAETAAQGTLDAEAIAVLAETDRAIARIAAGDRAGALSALEAAAGKAKILVGRNPANALIPAAAEVHVIDSAPDDEGRIGRMRRSLQLAVIADDLAKARLILDSLRSEIRVRTYHIPLGTYPDALAQTAALLDQQKNAEAAEVLNRARSTLVMVDEVTPLPLVVAQGAVEAARSDKDPQRKAQHLTAAREALERTEDLGYGDKETRKALLAEIRSLEGGVQQGSNFEAALERMQARISEALNRLSGERKEAGS
ncbi:YfdX family protein [Phenylobacterium zucineum]|nr:YfdX family protein [Phenylobacterium zucineum]